MTVLRDRINYPVQTIAIPAGALEEIHGMPSSITINENFHLLFEAWDSEPEFRAKDDPNPHFRREFPLSGAEFISLKESESEVFAAINIKALEFMEISGEDYAITSIRLDINNLFIRAEAKHKHREQTVSRTVSTLEEFVSVKMENPEFLGLLIIFMWTYGKTHDTFLASLN